jgi:effector-binding domain-containing protein
MRILKYIFLLLLLGLVALTVFVATQKGTYSVERSRVIKSPRSVIFNYVNDYRNWENFGSWAKDDPKMRFSYPAVTSGKGASYSWRSPGGDGNMQTIFVKDNDSISQKMDYNGSLSEVSWKFKDTVGGTKVTWRSKGKMNFMYKIYSVTKGGIDNLIGAMYEQSLANLDKTLDYEINTFTVAGNGIVVKSGTAYLQQTILSTIANAPTNMRIMLSKMTYFFKKNNITPNGKPFVLYYTYDTSKGLTRFSVGIPIRDEIHTSMGSDITFGKFDNFRAVRITLNGDYSHLPAAWKKGEDYLADNKLESDPNKKILEVFTTGIEENKSPSKWITHIYFPLQTAAPKPVVTTPRAPLPAAEEPVKPAE